MGNCLPKIRKYRKQFSQQGNHTKIGYPKVQGCCGRMRNCLPKIRWKVPVPIRRKRYSHKQTQTYSHPPGTIKEHVAKKDSMNSGELWYSTVSHDVKHEVAVIDSNNQTEYALVSVPKRKAKVASPEEHSEYDDILVTYSLPECVQP